MVFNTAHNNLFTSYAKNLLVTKLIAHTKNSNLNSYLNGILSFPLVPIYIVEEVVRGSLSPVAALFLIFKNDEKTVNFLFKNFFCQGIVTLIIICGLPLAVVFLAITAVSYFCCYCCNPEKFCTRFFFAIESPNIYLILTEIFREYYKSKYPKMTLQSLG